MAPGQKSPHNLPLAERFESFFFKRGEDDCWLWRGAKDRKGYGQFALNRNNYRSHQIAYLIYKGQWPSRGLVVMHSCDTPACVNPRHLSLGTDKLNAAQAWRRDRLQKVRKISRDDLLAIRQSTAPQIDLATKYGVHQSQISRLLSGKRGRGLLLIGMPEGTGG